MGPPCSTDRPCTFCKRWCARRNHHCPEHSPQRPKGDSNHCIWDKPHGQPVPKVYYEFEKPDSRLKFRAKTSPELRHTTEGARLRRQNVLRKIAKKRRAIERQKALEARLSLITKEGKYRRRGRPKRNWQTRKPLLSTAAASTESGSSSDSSDVKSQLGDEPTTKDFKHLLSSDSKSSGFFSDEDISNLSGAELTKYVQEIVEEVNNSMCEAGEFIEEEISFKQKLAETLDEIEQEIIHAHAAQVEAQEVAEEERRGHEALAQQLAQQPEVRFRQTRSSLNAPHLEEGEDSGEELDKDFEQEEIEREKERIRCEAIKTKQEQDAFSTHILSHAVHALARFRKHKPKRSLSSNVSPAVSSSHSSSGVVSAPEPDISEKPVSRPRKKITAEEALIGFTRPSSKSEDDSGIGRRSSTSDAQSVKFKHLTRRKSIAAVLTDPGIEAAQAELDSLGSNFSLEQIEEDRRRIEKLDTEKYKGVDRKKAIAEIAQNFMLSSDKAKVDLSILEAFTKGEIGAKGIGCRRKALGEVAQGFHLSGDKAKVDLEILDYGQADPIVPLLQIGTIAPSRSNSPTEHQEEPQDTADTVELPATGDQEEEDASGRGLVPSKVDAFEKLGIKKKAPPVSPKPKQVTTQTQTSDFDQGSLASRDSRQDRYPSTVSLAPHINAVVKFKDSNSRRSLEQNSPANHRKAAASSSQSRKSKSSASVQTMSSSATFPRSSSHSERYSMEDSANMDDHRHDHLGRTRYMRPVENISFTGQEMLSALFNIVSPNFVTSVNQLHGDRKGVIRITLKNDDALMELERLVHSKKLFINGVRVAFTQESGHFLKAIFMDIPEYMSSSDVEKELRQYGVVAHVRREYVEFHGHKFENETRHVLFSVMHKDLPSRMAMDGQEVFVTNKSQSKSSESMYHSGRHVERGYHTIGALHRRGSGSSLAHKTHEYATQKSHSGAGVEAQVQTEDRTQEIEAAMQ